MPRKARLDTPGTLHHVIIRGIEKGSSLPLTLVYENAARP